MKLAIFPASGGLGTSTYTHLLSKNLVIPADIILISRHPDKIPSEYKSAGVSTRQASWETSIDAYAHTFDGVQCLFLISYVTYEHERRVQLHRVAIDAARRSGVTHIFYSSLGFARTNDIQSAAYVMQAHLDTEEYLATLAAEDKEFSYTSIREGLYSESVSVYTSFFDLASPMKEASISGRGLTAVDFGTVDMHSKTVGNAMAKASLGAASEEVLIPHDGFGPGIAWVKRDELGEATAKLISIFTNTPFAKDFRYNNAIVLLSGSKVWSLSQTVEALSEVSGRDVSIRQVSVEEYAHLPHMRKALKTESARKIIAWATVYEAIRRGETAVINGVLGELLGREPEGFEETLKGSLSRGDGYYGAFSD